jgi:uncharacterized membrane protein
MKTFESNLSGDRFPMAEKIVATSIRKSLFDFIKEGSPDFKITDCLSITELNKIREKYVLHYISKQIGELTVIEKAVIDSISDKTMIPEKLDDDDQKGRTVGQQLADKVASFGGSWRFISFFTFFLIVWIVLNITYLNNKGFDPYPFILLNLILSCVAALQAPIIMMSQNRQEEKDRERAKKDYMVNLKSEIEIRNLHAKIDHLIMHQQQEFLELQRVQIEMMNDILSSIDKDKK